MLILSAHSCYTDIIQNGHVHLKEPVPSEEAVVKIIQGLKEDSDIGTDMLPTKMLKKSADVFAKPIRILALLILQQRIWPKAWMTQ